jgi:antitoxin ParD1/3/4
MATTLNISLPESLKDYIDAQAQSGDYATPSEYIGELVLADRDRRRQALEDRLVEALRGDTITFTSEEIERGGIIAQLRQKLQERQSTAA